MDVVILRAEMLRNWKAWISKVVNVIKELLPDAEIYVIGSVAEGNAIGLSDLDLLVVSNNIPLKPKETAQLKALIEEKAKLPLYHPLEIHLAKPKESKKYLKRSRKFIKLT